MQDNSDKISIAQVRLKNTERAAVRWAVQPIIEGVARVRRWMQEKEPDFEELNHCLDRLESYLHSIRHTLCQQEIRDTCRISDEVAGSLASSVLSCLRPNGDAQ